VNINFQYATVIMLTDVSWIFDFIEQSDGKSSAEMRLSPLSSDSN
jgi:hypothetical protein